ncbi:MAG: cyclopropane-fatty-acyl-phospholipid synthase family protein [Pseudomonadota bacterium]
METDPVRVDAARCAAQRTEPERKAPLPRWFETTLLVLQRIEAGRLEVTLPDGRLFEAQGTKPGPDVKIAVHDSRFFARLVRDGDMGFSESYLDGWWTTPDLQGVLDFFLLNNDVINKTVPGAGIVRAYERLRHWLRANSKAQARRNISHHYDLGNEFYRLWLDSSMTYSSALFQGRQETLETAQRNKYAAICDGIGVKPGDHLLEIGCGWGAFAEFAAAERGARVTALTISREQHDFARGRIAAAGLSDQVEIVMRDYRDERGRYDGIASIEMFEAVGERYWPAYFSTLHQRLHPGGRATLQVITIADRLFGRYRRGVDFIQKYIFPGGMLPSPTVFHRQASNAGLELVGSLEFGQSYSETLRRWHTTFNERWEEVRGLGFDDRFRRMWEFYLTSCAACFRAATTDVTQVTLRRPE